MAPNQDVVSEEAAKYSGANYYVDSDSDEVRLFVARAFRNLAADASKTERAVCLFDAVRDGIRYDPYTFPLEADSYRASTIAKADAAFCVPKAILLAACLRAAGVPAALGFADVRNHLSTTKLLELMETDLFIYHGYVQLWLNGKVYKVTPAFNMDLCKRFGVRALVFDGTSDAMFHEFNVEDQRHMEYVHDRGLYVDAPVADFLKSFKETYPKLEQLNRERISRGAEGVDREFAARGSVP